jgi:hypothetical protein
MKLFGDLLGGFVVSFLETLGIGDDKKEGNRGVEDESQSDVKLSEKSDIL